MSTIAKIYTGEVHKNLRPLFANWEPGQPIELGDYGPLENDSIIQVGNIKDLGIKFKIRKDPTKDKKAFSSKGSADFKLGTKGSVNIDGVVNTKPSLEISFTSEDAVFFNAAECEFQMIEDKAAVGKFIMDLYKKDKWDRAWAIVTDIVKAGATTVAVSGAKTSSIIFQTSGNVNRINLADASLDLEITSQKNIGYTIDASKGLIPLVGLSKIQSTFLWFGNKYKPLSLAMSPTAISIMENLKEIQTEYSPNDIYFGQLR